MKRAKALARSLPVVGSFLQFVHWSLRMLRGRAIALQKPINRKGFSYVHLGTDYGGWTLVDRPSLMGSVVISAGLGEDASFDIEFARRYGATVIVVDPTPRAIRHFGEVLGGIAGAHPSPSPNNRGTPYNLEGLAASQLILEPCALWTNTGLMSFYPPSVEEHVSYSLTPSAHDSKGLAPVLQVPATTLGVLIKKHGIARGSLELLKLDIEGAEVDVLERMLEDHIFPRQILVELDELYRPSSRAFERARRIDGLLSDCGYTRLHVEPIADFLYFRST